jgi:hypothetical protein
MTSRCAKRLALGCGILAVLLLAFGIFYRVKIDPYPPDKEMFYAVVTDIFVFDERHDSITSTYANLYITYEDGAQTRDARIQIQNGTQLCTKTGWKMQLTDLKIGQLIRVTTGTEMYYEPPTFYECYKVVAYPVLFAAESDT